MISPTHYIAPLLATLAIFFISCGSGNSAPPANAPIAHKGYDTMLVKGAVTDSVTCREMHDQNYALYLPTYYTPGKQFPCIYFFDAHARGAMPIRVYKDLAEKYGYVLIGSNVSKNGTAPQITDNIIKSLLEDASERINIDPRRVYTSGFSGGARVAVSVAISDTHIAGVIGCAAGFPTVEHGIQHKFNYCGMVGNEDFNLTEMSQLDETLAQNGFTHQLLTYNGKHDWPPAKAFEAALLWIQVNAIKEGFQPKNDALVTSFSTAYGQDVTAAKAEYDWIKAKTLLDGMANALNGLSDITGYQKEAAEIAANKHYTDAATMQKKLQPFEMGQQQELAKQFVIQDEKWWAKKIAELNQNIRNAKTPLDAQMHHRILNYLGLVGYMSANNALMAGDLSHAETFLKTFKLADPENPDCEYLTAIYFIKKGSTNQAIALLNEAVRLGYTDLSQLLGEPAFSTLHDDAGFKNIIRKIVANNSSKH